MLSLLFIVTNRQENPLYKVKALQNKSGKEVKAMEDHKIVRLYLERDEEAIRFTSEKYGRRLRTLAFGITSDIQTSEECENDTYLEAWNRIPPNEPKTYLFAFLARIIRHISIDRCRERTSLKRNGYVVELSQELEMCLPASDDVDSTMEAKMLGEAISRFLLTISQEKRVVFMRRYFYLNTVSEISSRVSISESKVKTMLFRIRNDLRDYLSKEGYTL